jgi:hypothetical protein
MTGPGNLESNHAPTEKDAASERLRRAIAARSAGSGSSEELEQAACALVGQLRGSNLPPEQMLLYIKEFLAESGLRPSYANPSDGSVGPNATLYRDLIAWCIKAYFNG